MTLPSLPSGDGKCVYEIAVRIINHDLTPIAPAGSYMSLWPFQSGLLLYMETILRLIPKVSVMQWINLFFVAITEISGYFFVKRCFNSVRTANFWCLLMGTCFPYFFYVNFVYGDVPSVGFLFFSAWMFAEYVHTDKLLYGIFAVLSAAGAVTVKSNSLIFVLASVLIFVVLSMLQKKNKHIAVIALLIVSTVAASKLPQKIYEYRADNIMGEGVPAVAYMAMGLQDDGSSKPGWWNGYHSDLMMEYNYDSERVAEVSLQSLEASIVYMARHPQYAMDFFGRKLISQWCDQNFSCFYSTKNLWESNRTEIAWSIYEGQWNVRILAFMNWHQSIVYIGGFLFVFAALVRWMKRVKYKTNTEASALNLWKLIFAVTVIGGFLFSVIWEGGSRYVFPYFVMLLPYAAAGLCVMSQWLESKFLRWKTKTERSREV